MSGGLRGGVFSVRPLELRRFVVVPGVRVGGSERRGGGLRLRVGGRAASAGGVRVWAAGRLRGRLGGRGVAAQLASRPPGARHGVAFATSRLRQLPH